MPHNKSEQDMNRFPENRENSREFFKNFRHWNSSLQLTGLSIPFMESNVNKIISLRNAETTGQVRPSSGRLTQTTLTDIDRPVLFKPRQAAPSRPSPDRSMSPAGGCPGKWKRGSTNKRLVQKPRMERSVIPGTPPLGSLSLAAATARAPRAGERGDFAHVPGPRSS